jgi:luciferase family oxidoreductase group 1
VTGSAGIEVLAMAVPLSVLDLYPVTSGRAPSRAIHDAVRLARRADELGYTRYWIAEHHNMPGIASAAPEVLIAHVASQTKRIIVGSGGIMMPNHTPLRVVEIFRTLEALHPGRIDLGVGRAPGTDPTTSVALRRRSTDVNDQLAELVAFARGTFPAGHPFASIVAMPSDAPVPPLWMLGSTQAGAGIAAELGVAFAFAGHFSMSEARGAMERYRREFTPRGTLEKPYALLAVAVICAETDARAEELALPLRVAYARIGQGRPAPFPTLEEAREYRFSPAEMAFVERFAEGLVIGSPARVREKLTAMASSLGASELMISTVVPDPDERIASYERLARAFEL